MPVSDHRSMQPLNAALPHAAIRQGPSAHGQGGAARTGEFLTFRLGSEACGIDILRIPEICTHEATALIAHAPGFIKGVVVDLVSGVLKLKPEQIHAAPEMNTAMDTGDITGITSVAERMRILKGIEALTSPADVGLTDPATPVH